MADLLQQLSTAFSERYRIERPLGEGGMALVFLASDLKHDRRVALKVLRPELAAVLGADRFLTEIRTTASLQHPHILPLFDSGQAQAEGQSFLYYVMPFIDGETLRQKIDRERQLAVDETVRISRAIATALDYAHRHGVVHRDIKPENVLLYEGQALVADFGIALAISQAGGMRVTETGLSVGTPHYMSPEQAAADRTLDARTDIYSLGAVLFEMLAGRRPFEAPTTPAVMSKILVEPAPSLRAERPSVPPNIDAAVQVALSKLPADRFSSAARFGEALADASYRAPVEGTAPRVQSNTPRWQLALWPVLVAAMAAVAWLGWKRSPPAAPVQRLQVDLPEGLYLSIRQARAGPLALSPNGSLLAFLGDSGTGSQLYVRELARFESRALEGTNGAEQPFFSPDGKSIGFFAGGSLQRVPVSGGAPVVIAQVRGRTYGASWGPDDRIIYSTDGHLYVVRATGSTAEAVATADSAGRPQSLRWPRYLPNGQILVSSDIGTEAVDLANHRVQHVFGGTLAHYVPGGRLVYLADDRRLRAIAFDVDRLEVKGSEMPVLDNVFRGPGSGDAFFDIAPQSGTLVYVQASFNRRLVLVDRNGRESAVPADPRGYRFPDVSPDGRHVAVTVDPRPSDLWIVDLVNGSAERQATPAHDGWGVWSPDGKRVASLEGAGRRFSVRAYPFIDAPRSLVPRDSAAVYPKVWTQDDELLSYRGDDIVAVSVRDGTVRELVATAAEEHNPALSPDGRWLAYDSDASGTHEVYVQELSSGARRQQVSSGGGVEPVWGTNGRELYFRRGNAIKALAVTQGANFSVTGSATTLFTGAYDFTQVGNWTVMPDGRFLMIRADPTTNTRFQVVLNWFSELNERMR